MAEEKVTFFSVFKTVMKRTNTIKSYVLFTLILLSLGFVITYVNYTDFAFISAILFIIILMPLIVTFAEYTALIETGAEPPRNFKVYTTLFANTYRSGRIKVFLSWKTLLFFILYLFMTTFLFMGGLLLFISVFDQPFMTQMMTIFNEMQVTTSPETYSQLTNDLINLFNKYNDPIMLSAHLITVLGIIFVFNKGVFNVYLSLFIEHRQGYRFIDLKTTFLGDKVTKRKVLGTQLLLTFISMLIFTLFYIGAYFLIGYQTHTYLRFLQAELIAVLSFAFLIPFTTRFYFYFYHRVMEPKRIEILKFTINELKAILKTPNLPTETGEYIAQILSFREQELDARLNPPKEEVKETEDNSSQNSDENE